MKGGSHRDSQGTRVTSGRDVERMSRCTGRERKSSNKKVKRKEKELKGLKGIVRLDVSLYSVIGGFYPRCT